MTVIVSLKTRDEKKTDVSEETRKQSNVKLTSVICPSGAAVNTGV